MARSPTARRRSPVLWLLFSFKGRISRSVYWPALIAVLILNLVFGREFFKMAEQEPTVGVLFLLLMLGCVAAFGNVAISVKRLHDVGYGGFLAVAVLVPIVQLAFNIWIGILPGSPDPNAYGAGPDMPP